MSLIEYFKDPLFPKKLIAIIIFLTIIMASFTAGYIVGENNNAKDIQASGRK
ncbi:MAG: hypothetical protein WCJ19_03935 [bacterium]